MHINVHTTGEQRQMFGSSLCRDVQINIKALNRENRFECIRQSIRVQLDSLCRDVQINIKYTFEWDLSCSDGLSPYGGLIHSIILSWYGNSAST